jgi:glycosyltransferase involved in cell wall biosynthesis
MDGLGGKIPQNSSSDSSGFTLVVSYHAPPEIGGTSAVMYELLRHFPSDSLVLLRAAAKPDSSRDDRRIDIRTLTFKSLLWSEHLQIPRVLLIPFTIFRAATNFKRAGTWPRNILAVFPTLEFLLVSHFLSKFWSVPLYVYLHDCIVETARGHPRKELAKMAEIWTFRNATKVYAMSSAMKGFYERKGLGSKIGLLPHGVDSKLLRKFENRPCRNPVRVGFAGMVYQTNDSAFKDLVEAKGISNGRLEIHLATSRDSRAWLERIGVADSIDSISTIETHEKLIDFLSSCDVLFLPLNFESIYYYDLLTIFPTKVTDYWLAQRPILVYGPREYAFVAEASDCGYAKVIHRRGGKSILEAVEEICVSPSMREALVKSSRRMIDLHDSKMLVKTLSMDLGILTSDSSLDN